MNELFFSSQLFIPRIGNVVLCYVLEDFIFQQKLRFLSAAIKVLFDALKAVNHLANSSGLQ